MRRYCPALAALFAGFALSAFAGAETPLKAGDYVAICGDSITEQKQYSVYMEDYLLMCQPVPKLCATQAGWSGEQARGFAARMAADVMPQMPTVATTCYGMNDGLYKAYDQAVADAYKESQRATIKAFKAGGTRVIVLGSPGAVDSTTYRKPTSTAEVYNDTLGKLGEIDKALAKEEGVLFADVHTPMMMVMQKAKAKYGDRYHVAGPDGVHPSANGHLIMAYAYLKAMGCDGDIATITLDLATGKAEATEGQKILSAKDGTLEMESTKYPFCFYGEPESPAATTGVLPFLPFNEELNRYMLVVKNAPGKIKVTWGAVSKEFPAEAAGKGINLAAEFLDNPFSDPFKAVEAKIRTQQNYETPLNKVLLHGLPVYDAAVPEEKDAVNKIRTALVNRDKVLQAQAAAAVVPVKYTLTVEVIK